MKQAVSGKLTQGTPKSQVISAGHFVLEDFTAEKGPNWDEEVKMYTTSAVAPVFVVHGLAHAGLLKPGSRVVLVSSEAGSIALRHPNEGGGLYGHHASKAALNMAGKLLAIDLRDRDVVVSIVHPGFMRTELTKSVGFDAHWDEGGAVTPDVAAKSLVQWVENLDMSKSGEYWAPRGPGRSPPSTFILRMHCLPNRGLADPSRRYRHGRDRAWKRPPHAAPIALVNTSMEMLACRWWTT